MLGPLPLGCCSVSAPNTLIASPSFSHPVPHPVPFFCLSEPLHWLCVLCAFWPGRRCLTQMPREGRALELPFSVHPVAGRPWPLTHRSWSMEAQFLCLGPHKLRGDVHSRLCLWDQAKTGALSQFAPWLGSFPSLLSSQSLTESSSLIHHLPSNT